MVEKVAEKVTAPQGERTGTAGATPRLVPESDLLAVKGSLTRQLEQSKAELDKTRSEIAGLRAEAEERQKSAALEGMTDIDQLKVLRKQTVKDRLELERRERELKVQEASLQTQTLDTVKRELAAELRVPVEVMVDATTREQAELMARRHLAGKPPQDNQPPVDLGRGGGAAETQITPHDRIKRGLEELLRNK